MLAHCASPAVRFDDVGECLVEPSIARVGRRPDIMEVKVNLFWGIDGRRHRWQGRIRNIGSVCVVIKTEGEERILDCAKSTMVC